MMFFNTTRSHAMVIGRSYIQQIYAGQIMAYFSLLIDTTPLPPPYVNTVSSEQERVAAPQVSSIFGSL